MVGHHLFMEDMMSDRSPFEIEMIAKKKAGIPFTQEEREILHGDCRPGITGGKIARDEYSQMLVERYEAGLWLPKKAKAEARKIIKLRGR